MCIKVSYDSGTVQAGSWRQRCAGTPLKKVLCENGSVQNALCKTFPHINDITKYTICIFLLLIGHTSRSANAKIAVTGSRIWTHQRKRLSAHKRGRKIHAGKAFAIYRTRCKCKLQIANWRTATECKLQNANSKLPTAKCKLKNANCKLQIQKCKVQIEK